MAGFCHFSLTLGGMDSIIVFTIFMIFQELIQMDNVKISELYDLTHTAAKE